MTQVRYHQDSPTKDSGDNLKKLLLYVIEQNNTELLGKKLKVDRTKLMVEKQSENVYKVIKFEMRNSILGKFEKECVYIFEVIVK